MLNITIDPNKLSTLLVQKRMTYEELADSITTTHEPNKKTVREWKRGYVSEKWVSAVANCLEIAEAPLRNRAKARELLRDVPEKDLMKLRAVQKGISKTAVGHWMNGNGIDTDRLYAVCEKLDVEPHQIISESTRKLLIALAVGNQPDNSTN